MKYTRITLFLFLCSTVFAIINVSAQYVSFADITIPSFKQEYHSTQHDKQTYSTQYLKKITCTDDLSGDQRAVQGKIHGMFAGMSASNWIDAPQNVNVSFGSISQVKGGWKLFLKSKNTFVTTASFWGTWTVD